VAIGHRARQQGNEQAQQLTSIQIGNSLWCKMDGCSWSTGVLKRKQGNWKAAFDPTASFFLY
jgi:hypothetical protein